MNRPYRTGFTTGRWQNFHNGHRKIINIGLTLCDKFLVFIGSSQESGTIRNPFSAQLRRKMIERCYPTEIEDGRLVLVNLPDIGAETDINKEWEDYLVANVKNQFDGEMAQLMVCGVGVFENEDRRTWFSKEILDNLDFHLVSRDAYPISATQLRKMLIDDDFEKWNQYVPSIIWRYFYDLRDELLRIPHYQNMRG